MELTRTFFVNDWEVKIAFYEPDNAVAPSKSGESLLIPGAGKYQVNTLQLASDQITRGEKLDLSIHISGENIAFLSTEVYLKDKEFDYYYGPVTQEFVRSKLEKDVNRLVHPIWDSEIDLTLQINPILRVLTDGINAAFAFMHPVGYGREAYQLEGSFTKKDSANSNRARLKFDSSGEMIDKRIILEKRGRLVSHNLAIRSGDMFIPAVQVLTALNLTNPKMRSIQGFSNTLAKVDEAFHWVDEAALPGDYLLGLVVEDFNGDERHHYLPFTIAGEKGFYD